MKRIALVGFGAIGQAVAQAIRDDRLLGITQIIVSPGKQAAVAAELESAMFPRSPRVVSTLELEGDRPDVLVECAGHGAITQHVVPALEQGVPCMIVSVGALSAPGLPEIVEAAALKGRTQVQLLSGAIGGIDALAAAKVAGLDSVTYVGRKPPLGWLGSQAEATVDLRHLNEAVMFFDGTAREAAHLFPKNANVAATLSLAGVGLDQTRVQLYADPGVTQNVHYYEARGAFGHLAVTMEGKPLAANPKTSALTVYSVVRALKNLAHPVAI